jgi:hypothetical protein
MPDIGYKKTHLFRERLSELIHKKCVQKLSLLLPHTSFTCLTSRRGVVWPANRRPRACRGAKVGGEGGIRTLETLLKSTRFRVVRLRPLGHLSMMIIISH